MHIQLKPAYMPYSDVCHIQIHICGYIGSICLCESPHIYGNTCEGVRELGQEVTGGAQPKKFGNRCFSATAAAGDAEEDDDGDTVVSEGTCQ